MGENVEREGEAGGADSGRTRPAALADDYRAYEAGDRVWVAVLPTRTAEGA